MREIEIASVDVIKNSTSSADKEFNTIAKLTDLVINGNTTVHSDDLVLIILMLETSKYSWDLKDKY